MPATTTPFTLHEPTPSHPPTHTMTFGRGGAGNRTSSSRLSPSRPSQRPLPPSSISTTSSTSSSSHMPNYSTGRGGAGNMHGADEDRRIFRFDEELAKEESRGPACPVYYHVGRGGVGNEVFEGAKGSASARRGSKSSSGSESSSSSAEREERDGGSALRGSLEWVRRRGLAGGRK